MNWRRLLAGNSLRATMTAGDCAVKPIGAKSRSESYFRLGVSTGAATCDPILPARSVYPSEGAAATRALPIVPPAPLTFSITIQCPRTLPICSVTTRATTSLGPPAGNGTTTLMDRESHDSDRNGAPGSTGQIDAGIERNCHRARAVRFETPILV